MVLIVTLAVTSSLGAPLIVLYAAPVPFFVLTGLIIVAFTSSCFLPKKLPDEAPEADEETQVYMEVHSENDKPEGEGKEKGPA